MRCDQVIRGIQNNLTEKLVHEVCYLTLLPVHYLSTLFVVTSHSSYIFCLQSWGILSCTQLAMFEESKVASTGGVAGSGIQIKSFI